jgi:hypothetical protein
MNATPKIAILEALTEMDNTQAGKVLDFVRSLLEKKDSNYQDYSSFRQEALREIRSALRQAKPGFTS